jgi:hypothetical protein
MSYKYSDQSNWLLDNNTVTNRIKIKEQEYARLDTNAVFDYPAEIVRQLKQEYDPKQEKGGLINFKPYLQEGIRRYVAVEVIFINNVSESKRISYQSDSKELNDAYKNALGQKLLPLAFHTHPTVHSEENTIVQGINFLHQLNTSIQDRGVTRWCINYNGVDIRLPELLIVENSKALFIGMYGGLVSPLSFTEQKNKALESTIENTLEHISEWADTPGRKALLALSVFGLLYLAVRYPKVTLPSAVVIGVTAPPFIFASRDKHEFFGMTYTQAITIHVPKLSDSEIIEHEMKAIEAQAEAKRIREEKKGTELKFTTGLFICFWIA